MTKKLTNINELLRQMSILDEDEQETLKKALLKKQKKNVEPDDDDDDDDDSTKVASIDDEPEADDDEPEADDEPSDDSDDDSPDEVNEESNDDSQDEVNDDTSDDYNDDSQDDSSQDDSNDDSSEVTLEDVFAKVETLNENFTKFRTKVVSLLEAMLSIDKYSIGLKEDEQPRVVKEKKVLATINTASGELDTEVSAYKLRLDEQGVLHLTQEVVFIHRGDAVEDQLPIRGKIPNGNWVVVERKQKYYLVSVDNVDFDDVTPYENDEKDKETGKGKVVNKKGSAHNVRGYLLEDNPDYFRLTKHSLAKPRRVFDAKWTKQDCDFPVKGEPIPEGTWVIVTDGDDWFLVKSDDVQPKISTKRTEKEEPKKSPSKKTVNKKKVAKKNKK